jgi:hypothetical protein
MDGAALTWPLKGPTSPCRRHAKRTRVMGGVRRHVLVRLLFIGAAMLVASGCNQRDDDSEVIEIALRHLADQLDGGSQERDGILLLRSQTAAWTEQTLRVFPEDASSGCKIPKELYSALLDAAQVTSVFSLLKHPESWHVASKEIEQRVPVLPPEQLDGVPAITMVTVSVPGFAKTNNEVVVVLHFTRLIHDSVARIRLEPSGTTWKVKCSQLNHYL